LVESATLINLEKYGFGKSSRIFMKKLIIYVGLACINFIANFAIYNFSFNSQATHFLTEEQRVDSALLMLQQTAPAYAVSAIVITLLFYFVSKKNKE